MKHALLVLLVALFATPTGAQEVPPGKLGHPIGTYLRIEGVRVEGPKHAGRTLLVDTVNGKRLAQPTDVAVENVDALPTSSRCILRGYETGGMVGVPPAVFEAAKEEGKVLPQPQAGWQFRRCFIVISVIEPKDLKKK